MCCMMVSLLFGAAFVLLLAQAFKLMRQGMDAANRPMDTIPKGSDRTGIRTIHPEMLDRNGQLVSDELLTVRFSGDNDAAEPQTLPE